MSVALFLWLDESVVLEEILRPVGHLPLSSEPALTLDPISGAPFLKLVAVHPILPRLIPLSARSIQDGLVKDVNAFDYTPQKHLIDIHVLFS